jgi:uncharacterized RDD family membrane protein YckC
MLHYLHNVDLVLDAMDIIEISHTAAPSSSNSFVRNGDHAGFWLRFLAYLWDSLIIALFFGIATYVSSKLNYEFQALNFNTWGQFALPLGLVGLSLSTLLYYTLSEASCLAATPGKFLMGLRVIDYSYNQPSIARALVRNMLKQSWLFVLGAGTLLSIYLTPLHSASWSFPILMATAASSATLVLGGHLMAGFTEEKQALHDKATDCFVVKNLVVTSLQRWFFGLLIVLLLLASSNDRLEQEPLNITNSASKDASLSLRLDSEGIRPISTKTDQQPFSPAQESILTASQVQNAPFNMEGGPSPMPRTLEGRTGPDSIPPSHEPTHETSIMVGSTEYIAQYVSTKAQNHILQVELLDNRRRTLGTLTMELDRFSNDCNLQNLRIYSIRIDPLIMGFAADTDIEFARSMSSLDNHDVSTLHCMRNDTSQLELNVNGKGIVQKNNGSSLPVYWNVRIKPSLQQSSTSRIVKMSDLLHS